MRNNYVERAEKFMKSFVRNYGHPFGCKNIAEVRDMVERYNAAHKRIHVSYSYGISRCTLILSDYVIKWDYDAENVMEWGGCKNEMKIYAKACKMGLHNVLAPITRIKVYGRFYYVMPRCTRTAFGDKHHDLTYYIGEAQMWGLHNRLHLIDLHCENWGFLHGQATIFDYAACCEE